MTDKQIIDVSKCKECGLRNCEGALIYWCHTYDDHCQDFDNCYYKQLKRKEQECEELKKQHQADKGLITSIGKMNYQLLQEYDKLKAALTEIKEIAEKQCVCGVDCIDMKQILQKISECEGNDEH